MSRRIALFVSAVATLVCLALAGTAGFPWH